VQPLAEMSFGGALVHAVLILPLAFRVPEFRTSIAPRGNSRPRLTRRSPRFEDSRTRGPPGRRRDPAARTLQGLRIIGWVFSRIQFPDAIFFSPGESSARGADPRGWQMTNRERERESARARLEGGEEGWRCGAAHIRALWHVPSRSQLN